MRNKKIIIIPKFTLNYDYCKKSLNSISSMKFKPQRKNVIQALFFEQRKELLALIKIKIRHKLILINIITRRKKLHASLS